MGAGAPAEPSLRPWGVVFPLCSGDDGGSAAAGSLMQLGYFQRNGYERAQHCLEEEEEGCEQLGLAGGKSTVKGFYCKHWGRARRARAHGFSAAPVFSSTAGVWSRQEQESI